jgi:phosphatidylserine decarboxylase
MSSQPSKTLGHPAPESDSPPGRVLDRGFVALQHLLPQRALSSLVHWFMRRRSAWLKNLQIRTVGRLAGVDFAEAADPDPAAYATFNDFFTRALKPGTRPLAPPPALLSPADGRISACGNLRGNRLLQAKGHDYSLEELLADDPACADLRGGVFWTVYLSPRDYHRVHIPAAGRLRRMTHVPGRLFSVSPHTVRELPNLFARNERVVCLFETSFGPMAVVLVGAMLVGSMDTVWSGTVTPTHGPSPGRRDYAEGEVSLARGEELGRFNMGSTVIVVTPPGAVVAGDALTPGTPVRVGEAIGRICV